MYLDEWVEITANAEITPQLLKLTFRFPALAEAIQPGQFFQVALDESSDPFLRRPFTVYRVAGDCVEVLYEIVGKGTALLAKKKPGDSLKIMGPLGNTFTEAPGRVHIAVGGGVGIAPFIFFRQKRQLDYLLMGARGKQGLLTQAELGDLWPVSRFATNDGSAGDKGFITGTLSKLIEELPEPKKAYLYICGPRPMIKAVTELAAQLGIGGEASVDERMGCGIGACLGCVVETRDGYKTSCREGTVFPLKDLVFS